MNLVIIFPKNFTFVSRCALFPPCSVFVFSQTTRERFRTKLFTLTASLTFKSFHYFVWHVLDGDFYQREKHSKCATRTVTSSKRNQPRNTMRFLPQRLNAHGHRTEQNHDTGCTVRYHVKNARPSRGEIFKRKKIWIHRQILIRRG